jgi:thiosulfate dehydrogenase (quinone) large subunit
MRRSEAGLSEKKAQKRVTGPPAAPRATSDPWLAYATLPLRFFLGGTFIYAGLQKIADPGFLQPGSSTYIGTQLQAFASHSPIGLLVETFGLATPQLTGMAVIAAELAIGVLVMGGVATRWAAAAGALVNFTFFLTASWTVQPYFLGSDSIYTVAWITLAMVGDQGLLTARPLLFGDAASRDHRPVDPDRRRLLLQLGGAVVAVVWVLSVLPRTRRLAAAAPSPTPSAEPTATPSAQPSATPSSAPPTPTGTRIGATSDLQSQGFLNFNNPSNGDPAVAVQTPGGVVAYDAVCTHAGCTVNYDTSQKLLVCPCHGATFDPANGGAVLSGPALTPLPPIHVEEASDGGVYAG